MRLRSAQASKDARGEFVHRCGRDQVADHKTQKTPSRCCAGYRARRKTRILSSRERRKVASPVEVGRRRYRRHASRSSSRCSSPILEQGVQNDQPGQRFLRLRRLATGLGQPVVDDIAERLCSEGRRTELGLGLLQVLFVQHLPGAAGASLPGSVTRKTARRQSSAHDPEVAGAKPSDAAAQRSVETLEVPGKTRVVW